MKRELSAVRNNRAMHRQTGVTNSRTISGSLNQYICVPSLKKMSGQVVVSSAIVEFACFVFRDSIKHGQHMRLNRHTWLQPRGRLVQCRHVRDAIFRQEFGSLVGRINRVACETQERSKHHSFAKETLNKQNSSHGKNANKQKIPRMPEHHSFQHSHRCNSLDFEYRINSPTPHHDHQNKI
jgi:hypothetical protein